jgi:DNA-binding CsgD family transcriptional regulator
LSRFPRNHPIGAFSDPDGHRACPSPGRTVQRRQGEKRAAHETLEQALAIFDQVARALCLSAKTVAWNLSKVYRKLGVRSRTELAARGQPSNRR